MKTTRLLPSDQVKEKKQSLFSWNILPGCFDPFCRDYIHEEQHKERPGKKPLKNRKSHHEGHEEHEETISGELFTTG